MLKILERKITLQLLVFYALFVIPLLLGGAELYSFQYRALQQSAQQTDLGLAQAIAQDVETRVGTGRGTGGYGSGIQPGRDPAQSFADAFSIQRFPKDAS